MYVSNYFLLLTDQKHLFTKRKYSNGNLSLILTISIFRQSVELYFLLYVIFHIIPKRRKNKDNYVEECRYFTQSLMQYLQTN